MKKKKGKKSQLGEKKRGSPRFTNQKSAGFLDGKNIMIDYTNDFSNSAMKIRQFIIRLNTCLYFPEFREKFAIIVGAKQILSYEDANN